MTVTAASMIEPKLYLDYYLFRPFFPYELNFNSSLISHLPEHLNFRVIILYNTFTILITSLTQSQRLYYASTVVCKPARCRATSVYCLFNY